MKLLIAVLILHGFDYPWYSYIGLAVFWLSAQAFKAGTGL